MPGDISSIENISACCWSGIFANARHAYQPAARERACGVKYINQMTAGIALSRKRAAVVRASYALRRRVAAYGS